MEDIEVEVDTEEDTGEEEVTEVMGEVDFIEDDEEIQLKKFKLINLININLLSNMSQ